MYICNTKPTKTKNYIYTCNNISHHSVLATKTKNESLSAQNTDPHKHPLNRLYFPASYMISHRVYICMFLVGPYIPFRYYWMHTNSAHWCESCFFFSFWPSTNNVWAREQWGHTYTEQCQKWKELLLFYCTVEQNQPQAHSFRGIESRKQSSSLYVFN